MATETNKFLTLVSGVKKLAIAISSSAGVGDADKIVSTNASGVIDATLLPSGVGAETVVLAASEDLAAKDQVNIWNDGGTLKVRKANATTTGKPADGYIDSAVTTGNNATVYRGLGTISGLTGLTLEADYFLSTSDGLITTTSPESNGNVSQYLGYAISTTELAYEPEKPIQIDIA